MNEGNNIMTANIINRAATLVVCTLFSAGSALAETSAADIARLGKDLTPFGAEAAGNADGTIPAWSGGSVTTGDGRRLVNPFPDDKEKFRIDSSNVSQYSDKLSPGQIEMLQRNPEFFMPVFETRYAQAPVQSNGAYTLQRLQDRVLTRTSLTKDADQSNMLIMFQQKILQPARLEGNVLLVHETIDQVVQPRLAWVYNAGQRRVRRAPNIAYDSPGTAAEGMRTTDDFDMYNGSPDKYDWNLVGKREMYIPANSYSIADNSVDYSDVIGPKHLNQQFTRYELRRVWEVEGTLKEGERHIYGKRTFYFDEDSWTARIGDTYDSRGELWRFMESHRAYESTIGFMADTGQPIYDFQANRYLVLNLISEENKQFVFNEKISVRDFTPSALRRSGRK